MEWNDNTDGCDEMTSHGTNTQVTQSGRRVKWKTLKGIHGLYEYMSIITVYRITARELRTPVTSRVSSMLTPAPWSCFLLACSLVRCEYQTPLNTISCFSKRQSISNPTRQLSHKDRLSYRADNRVYTTSRHVVLREP